MSGYVIKAEGNTLTAFKGDQAIWRFELDAPLAGDPIIVGDNLVLVTESNGRILGIDPRSGQQRWTANEKKGEGKGNGKGNAEPKPAAGGAAKSGAENDKAAEELVATWAELVEMREQAAADIERALKDGKASLAQLGVAREELLQAQIGYAKAARQSHKQLLGLYEEQLKLLEQQAVQAPRLLEAGEATPAEVQQARALRSSRPRSNSSKRAGRSRGSPKIPPADPSAHPSGSST
jgi:hypothetical protein